MPVCIVENCFSGSKRKGLYCDPKVHLHRFPKDVEMRALWVKQIQRTANVNKEINCDTGKLNNVFIKTRFLLFIII